MKFKLVEKLDLFESKADDQKLIDFAGEDLAKRFLALRYRFKSPENDLYYWIKKKSAKELEAAVNELEQTKSKTQVKAEAEEGAELIGENDYWKVYHITTFEACQKYGRDTKWCITGINNYGRRYWNQYTRKGIQFYFYITKGKYDPRGANSKFALAYSSKLSNNYEIYDQQDNVVTCVPNAPIIAGLPDISGQIVDTFIYKGQTLPAKTMIRNLIIDGSIGKIEEDTFRQNTSIEHVIVQEGITEIGSCAFIGCGHMISIELPDTLLSIGDFAFGSCCRLRSLKFPDSITEIPGHVAVGAQELREVSLGKNVNSIDVGAFFGCCSLTNITIPDSVTAIGQDALMVRKNYTKDFSINCSRGSYAEQYAKRHHIPVNYLNESYSLRFKLVESIDDRLVEVSRHNKRLYYHGNNDRYEVGDIILKDYDFDANVIDIYNQYLNPLNVKNCVYMLDHFSDEYKDCYDHYYIVEAANVKKGLMAYSPFICSEDILKSNKYKSMNDEQREKFINQFAKAYCGLLTKDELEKFSKLFYEGGARLKPEWISDKVKVVKILK